MNDSKKAKQRAALAVHKVKKFASTNVKDLYDKIGSQTLKIKALEDNELSLNNKIDSLEEKDWYSDSVSASQNRHDESLKKYFGIDRDNNNDRDHDNDGPTNDRGEHSSTNSDGSDVEDLDDDEDDEME